MLVMVKRVGEELKVEDIKNDLDTYQEIVGGYIETPFISRELRDNKILLVANDEGKIEGLEPTLAIINSTNMKIVDYISGNYILCSLDGEDFGALNQEQMEVIQEFIIKDACMYGDSKRADGILI